MMYAKFANTDCGCYSLLDLSQGLEGFNPPRKQLTPILKTKSKQTEGRIWTRYGVWTPVMTRIRFCC